MEENNKVQRLGESRNSIYWILYHTLNIKNNKIYIGVHKTPTPYEFDGYIGNGIYITQPSSYIYSKTALEAAVKKYGTSSFVRTVLKVFDNEDDAYKAESDIVNEEFIARPDVYNMVIGGKNLYCEKATTPIYQYSLSGDFLKEYSSFKEVEKLFKVGSPALSEVCSCNTSCKGFYWSKTKVDRLNLSAYKSTKVHNALHMYDLEGNYIKSFPSAQDTGYSQASVSAILGNIVDGKYRFCYIKADSYDKARNEYVNTRVIYQYDSNGKFLKTWKYIDALREYPNDKLNQSMRHKTITKSGYFWGYCKYSQYNAPVKKQSRRIAKYTPTGELVEVYNNSSECYRVNGKNCYKVLVGNRKSYKGYIYKYIE